VAEVQDRRDRQFRLMRPLTNDYVLGLVTLQSTQPNQHLDLFWTKSNLNCSASWPFG
jgi:hypothetical protein